MPEMTVEQAMELALGLRTAGKWEEAESCYRQIVAAHAGFDQAWFGLAITLKRLGRPEEAVGAYRKTIDVNPKYAEAYSNLGNLLQEVGKPEEALKEYGEAMRLRPDVALVRNNLGNALGKLGRLEEAIGSFREALRLDPRFAEAHNNLGLALVSTGRLEEAFGHFMQALRLKPAYPEAHLNLGNALVECGRLTEAEGEYRTALRLAPDFAPAHNNLGSLLREMGRLEEGVAECREALRLLPDFAAAQAELAATLAAAGQLEEGIAAYRTAMELNPSDATIQSSLMVTMLHQPETEGEALLEEARSWARRHAEVAGKEVAVHENERRPEKRLRIGYVSPDLREHSVARFLLPLLQHHDHEQFEIFCYADGLRSDEMTEELRNCADEWRELAGVPDAAAAKLIREDGIDILVDLAGHTARNRLLVFALKPAPVQASYLGYAATTGLEAIDYRLTDGLADPAGSEALYTEGLWRLPRTNWCYAPRADAPDVTAAAARGGAAGHGICFGSFGNVAKVVGMLETWGEILRGVPGSRLFLKARGMEDGGVRRTIEKRFAQQGVEATRLELRGRLTDPVLHLGAYGEVDIALDTYPYHGTATTCEALWMGVPVVTLAGKTHVSRVGVSLLTNVGLGEMASASKEEYVKKALALAADEAQRAELRGTLRERMRGSALMNGAAFARDVEGAYRRMWEKWCSRK